MKTNFFVLAVILLFYIWTATFGYFNFNFKGTNNNYYNLLTDAFLKKQLNLPVKIPKKLLEAKNPYDPKIAGQFVQKGLSSETGINFDDGLVDLSLYKGKLYLYFGPSPVLTLYLPYRLLTGFRLSDHLAIVIFSFGIVVFLMLIFNHLAKTYFTNLPNWLIPFCLMVISFSNVMPFAMRRPSMYGIALSSGIFFLLAAAYVLIRQVKKDNYFLLAVTGLLFGLAIGSRPNLLISIAFLIVVYLINLIVRRLVLKQIIANLFFLTSPLLLIGFLLAAYNYVRFGSITDFGCMYQISATDFSLFNHNYLSLKYLPWNIFVYFFFPPLLIKEFPFIDSGHLSYDYEPKFFTRSTGLIFSTPFIVLLVISLVCISSHIQEKRKDLIKFLPKYELAVFAVLGLVNFFVTSCHVGNTTRYMADFMTFSLIAISILVFYCFSTAKPKSTDRFMLLSFTLISGLISILFGFAISITGQFAGLKVQNPELFHFLNNLFKRLL